VSAPGRRATPAPTEASRATLNILDSVCALYFAASGQIRLLIDILTAADYTILLPDEVLRECEKRAREENWNISGLHKALGGRIQLIPRITAATPRAMSVLTSIRKGHPKGIQGSANLGECVCITHALGAAASGRRVVVSLDDGDGQVLAKAKKVTYFTIEDALEAGVTHEVITRAQARDAYRKLVPYGSSLPTWNASELKPRLGM
jgi:hypothetical protein